MPLLESIRIAPINLTWIEGSIANSLLDYVAIPSSALSYASDAALSPLLDDHKTSYDDIPPIFLGLIMRTYTSPHHDHNLIHVRSGYSLFGRKWHDVGLYRDKIVPAEILQRVYEASRQFMQWDTTDKEARFGRYDENGHDEVRADAAWEVLDGWYRARVEEDDTSKAWAN